MSAFFDLVYVYALLTCAVALLWYFSKSTFDFWRKLNVNYMPPVPFFGNVANFVLMREPVHKVYHQIYAYFKDEPFGGCFQMRSPTLMVKDPELVQKFLVSDFGHFHDRGFGKLFSNMDKKLNPLNEHLFLVEGDRWRVFRQKMSGVFTSSKLKNMHDQMAECVVALDQCIDAHMRDDVSVDLNLKALFESLTIDVIGTCAFGLSCNSTPEENDRFRRMGALIFKPRFANVVRLILGIFSKKVLALLGLADLRKDVQDFYLNVVLDTIEYRRKHKITRNDVLQLLMDLQNTSLDRRYSISGQETHLKINETFDELDVAANAFVFFVAGYETTASTLTFCLYELSLNEQIQNKLRAEVQTVLDKHGKLTPENLKELTYMDNVLAETLRKYPVVAILNRECTADYIIPKTDVKLPTDTKIVIPVWSIHHDYKYYPNPEVFDPDRFTPENVQTRPAGTYIPFGDGPRYCIGKRFAYLEMKTALAHLIVKYNFRPCPDTEIPLNFVPSFFILRTKNGGVRVNISRRK